MNAPTTERRATEVATKHAAGVAGLDRCAASLREAIAANERLLRRTPAAQVIERHPMPTRRPMPAWVEQTLNWATAIALGVIVGYMAGAGF